jgi:hypothetical protein
MIRFLAVMVNDRGQMVARSFPFPLLSFTASRRQRRRKAIRLLATTAISTMSKKP